MIRKIITIDEEKCNGCGLCAAACHEGAIGMVNGKAKLLREDYCDGLGDCLPACPTNAVAANRSESTPKNTSPGTSPTWHGVLLSRSIIRASSRQADFSPAWNSVRSILYRLFPVFTVIEPSALPVVQLTVVWRSFAGTP